MLTVNGTDIDIQDIDYITPEDEQGNETEDFINAYQYRIVFTDESMENYDGYELVVEREGLDGSSYEMILDIIQPT